LWLSMYHFWIASLGLPFRAPPIFVYFGFSFLPNFFLLVFSTLLEVFGLYL
ncbi:hypothetical protein BDV24DRAFT_121982, partial [Aspergillus arachidicola]